MPSSSSMIILSKGITVPIAQNVDTHQMAILKNKTHYYNGCIEKLVSIQHHHLNVIHLISMLMDIKTEKCHFSKPF